MASEAQVDRAAELPAISELAKELDLDAGEMELFGLTRPSSTSACSSVSRRDPTES
jgi:hypothetical protein